MTRSVLNEPLSHLIVRKLQDKERTSENKRFSPTDSNTFNQVTEAKSFEGVFLCRKVC